MPTGDFPPASYYSWVQGTTTAPLPTYYPMPASPAVCPCCGRCRECGQPAHVPSYPLAPIPWAPAPWVPQWTNC